MFEIINALIENPDFQNKVKFTSKHFNAKDKILVQGEQHPNFFLIKNGTVRVTVTTLLKEEETAALRPGVADLGPNDIFGEFGLFDDLPASADVASVVESELLEIDIPSFKAYLNENPTIGYKIYQELLQTLVKRLRHADKVIYNLYAWGIKAHQLDKYL
jgi:CRP/FNR family cyclic AMP-dependent transcriptional regulator